MAKTLFEYSYPNQQSLSMCKHQVERDGCGHSILMLCGCMQVELQTEWCASHTRNPCVNNRFLKPTTIACNLLKAPRILEPLPRKNLGIEFEPMTHIC